MPLSLGVSLAVFAVIAAREWLPGFLKIWHVMVAGAAVLLLSTEISPAEAMDDIDWNIIAYLFGVFSIGRALFDNGLSQRIAVRMVGLGSRRRLLLAFVAVFALISAVLTNDAAAIIGTPIALALAGRIGADPRIMLVVLCATVTVGSVATPIGNPQNLLIAASGDVPEPVLTFLAWLIVPTLLGLAVVFIWFAGRLGGAASSTGPAVAETVLEEAGGPLWPVALAVGLLVVLVVGESVLAVVAPGLGYPLGAAAVLAALPVYLFAPTRWRTLARLDWPTLAFFIAMFIVTGALLRSGALQSVLGSALAVMTEPAATAAFSLIGSQVVSNVPFVDIYLKLLPSAEVDNLMMLAAVSTLAGNAFIISAASNVIVLQMAERLGGPEIHFWAFARLVVPVGLITTGVAVVWILGLSALLPG